LITAHFNFIVGTATRALHNFINYLCGNGPWHCHIYVDGGHIGINAGMGLNLLRHGWAELCVACAVDLLDSGLTDATGTDRSGRKGLHCIVIGIDRRSPWTTEDSIQSDLHIKAVLWNFNRTCEIFNEFYLNFSFENLNVVTKTDVQQLWMVHAAHRAPNLHEQCFEVCN
jgi:hypothetical protein